jgi:hypothetical protein
LEHTIQFPFQPFEWENKEQENGAYKCVNKGERCDISCMDFKNVGMWTFNNITKIEDESCGTHLNNTNTIQTQNPKEDLMILV